MANTDTRKSIKDLTDLELVLMFQATRENKFFNELFRRHKNTNVSWQIRYTLQALKAQHYGVDEHEAESAIMWAFLKAIDSVDVTRITNTATFKFAVPFNTKCKEYRYNRRTFHHAEIRSINKTVYVDAFEHYDNFLGYTPDNSKYEFQVVLTKFINTLSDVEQVLVHCLSDGLTVIEAAKMAGRSVPSMRLIKQKLRRKAETFGLNAYLT